MKTSILATYLVTVLLLVSCSGRVYTYRKTCKVNIQETAEARPVKKIKEEKSSLPLMNEDLSCVTENEEMTTADAGTTIPVIYKPVYKQEVKAVKAGNDKMKMKPVVQKLKREIKKNADGLGMGSMEKKLIIAGLIFVLAGVILYLVSGAAGALLTTIGVVLIIVGLLLWLIDFL